MKPLLTSVSNVQTSSTSEKYDYRLSDNTGHLTKILRDSLYKDKLGAVVREYITNALDAHVEARVNTPVMVHIPTQNEPWFGVRDFGKGLSHEDIIKYYFTYGASSKHNTALQAGMFGIGCKAAFAYTDSFTIESYHGGKKRIYAAFLNQASDGNSAGQLIHEEDTTESGIQIRVPVSLNHDDRIKIMSQVIYDFMILARANVAISVDPADLPSGASKILKQTKFKKLDNGYYVYDSCDAIVIDEPHITVYSASEYTYRNSFDTKPCVVSNNVVYPLAIEVLKDFPFTGAKIVIRVAPGLLQPTASREAIDDSENNTRVIKLHVDMAKQEFQKAAISLTEALTDRDFASMGTSEPYRRFIELRNILLDSAIQYNSKSLINLSDDINALYMKKYSEYVSRAVDMSISEIRQKLSQLLPNAESAGQISIRRYYHYRFKYFDNLDANQLLKVLNSHLPSTPQRGPVPIGLIEKGTSYLNYRVRLMAESLSSLARTDYGICDFDYSVNNRLYIIIGEAEVTNKLEELLRKLYVYYPVFKDIDNWLYNLNSYTKEDIKQRWPSLWSRKKNTRGTISSKYYVAIDTTTKPEQSSKKFVYKRMFKALPEDWKEIVASDKVVYVAIDRYRPITTLDAFVLQNIDWVAKRYKGYTILGVKKNYLSKVPEGWVNARGVFDQWLADNKTDIENYLTFKWLTGFSHDIYSEPANSMLVGITEAAHQYLKYYLVNSQNSDIFKFSEKLLLTANEIAFTGSRISRLAGNQVIEIPVGIGDGSAVLAFAKWLNGYKSSLLKPSKVIQYLSMLESIETTTIKDSSPYSALVSEIDYTLPWWCSELNSIIELGENLTIGLGSRRYYTYEAYKNIAESINLLYLLEILKHQRLDLLSSTLQQLKNQDKE